MPELVCAADSPGWLAERRKGVTATDIAAITGLSPYESEYSLYWKKLGQIPDTREDSPRLRLGRDLEPIIAMRWREDTGKPVLPGLTTSPGLFRSSARPWQMATIDRFTDDRQPVEFKSWADADRDRWTDQPPARVRAQVLWQMDTLDVATGHVGVLFLPSGDFRSYVIEHETEFHSEDHGWTHTPGCAVCADLELLRALGEEFMTRLAEHWPPSPDASSATLAALKARFADPVPGKDAEIDADLYGSWVAAKVTSDHFADQAREHEALIREQAGEAKYLTVGGVKVATRVVSDSNVQAHTRHVDYYRRVKNGDPE